MESYQATVSTKVDLGGMSVSVQMEQWYQKPDKVRADVDMQYVKQTTIRDGKDVTVYLPQFGKALRMRNFAAGNGSANAPASAISWGT